MTSDDWTGKTEILNSEEIETQLSLSEVHFNSGTV